MKFPLLALLSCVLAIQPAPAAEIVDIQDGPTLAAHLRHLVPQEEGRFQGTLHITRPEGGEWVVPFTSQTQIKGDSWEISYETTPLHGLPAQKLTVVHSPDHPNTYLYSTATNGGGLSAPQKLSGSQAYIPFANSHFWLVDLGLDFFHWPKQKLLEPQMRRSRPCKVLESRPAADSPSPYSKIISWIDNETGGIIRAEAYDQQNKRWKEFNIVSFAKVEGQWQLQTMEIRDLKASRSRTLLQFDLETEPRADSKP